MSEKTAKQSLLRGSRGGFTLVELLAVVTIMLLLMGMVMGGITAVRNAARKNKVKADISSLEHAVKAYLNDVGKLPIPEVEQGSSEPHYFARDNDSTNVVWMLTTTNNPRAVVYLEAQNNTSPGVFLDPWAGQYAFKFDADYNGVLAYPNGTGENIPSPVVVISFGPNGVQDDPKTGDDFVSEVWQNRSAQGL